MRVKPFLYFKPNLIFYLLIAGLFLIITSPFTFSEGIFMDGLFYASISKNLSHGIGSFWQPHFSNTLFPSFYEHPPLALGIQSIFFKILGDHHYTEKLYSLLCILLNGVIICRIWILLSLRHAWIPLLVWLSIPLVQWSSSNNLLENTVSIFTSLSLYFYLKARKPIQIYIHTIYLLLAGSMLFLAFISKGFVGFFPLACPLFFNLFLKKFGFNSFIKELLLMSLGIAVPLILLISLNQQALICLQSYFKTQVLNSIYYVQTVESRWYLIQRCFLELIPAFILCAITVFTCKQQNLQLKISWNKALPFLLVAISAVFPMMISLKQSGFYILPSFPFFSIGIGILIYPAISHLVIQFNTKLFALKLLSFFSLLMFITGILLSISKAHTISRDLEKLNDIHRILNYLEEYSTIGISKNLWTDWSLHGYFIRYKNISLDTSSVIKTQFFLTNLIDPGNELNSHLEPILQATQKYQFYEVCTIK